MFVPNFNSFGIAFVNNNQSIAIAMGLGALIAFIWERRDAASYNLLMVALSSGLVAGEGLFGVIEAIFTMASLDKIVTIVDWGIPA